MLLTYAEALDRILSAIAPLGSERVPLADALGRCAAGPVSARVAVPPEANSAMDGYALRWTDQGGPLRITQEIPAGGWPTGPVESGEAARIFTGAPVPPDADTVVAQERCTREGDRVVIDAPESLGANIRAAGEDVQAGADVLRAAEVLSPSSIGLLAAQGITWVDVGRRPVVAILATGDEIHEPGDPLPPGHLWSGNSHALAAAVTEAGGVPRMLGIARDDRGSLRRALDGIRNADVLLTIGGVSVGEYDFVKEAIDELGGVQEFWKVRVRPGKPNAFGRLGTAWWFGLPGNPVSCMVSHYQYVRPALLKMQGRSALFLPTRTAILEHPIEKRAGFTIFFRGQVRWEDGRYLVRTTGPQGSGILSSMAQANCFIAASEATASLPAGAEVTVQLFPSAGAAQADTGIGR